jgi:putative membrane-bound dehydrogenase-like protein
MNNSPGINRKAAYACGLAISVAWCCRPGLSASPETNGRVSGRAEPGEATNAFPGFQVEKGFRLELVASEPLVIAPVAMAFDENGRLFVAEMPGAAGGSSAQPQRGRIRMLQDTNGDGAFETSTVYANDLPEPSALACYDGGLFIGTMPNLLYLKKTGTNDSTEERTVVYSLVASTNAVAEPARLNNLNWGPDNRIHGVTGAAAGGWSAARTQSRPPAPMEGTALALDPRARTVSAGAGPACSGLSFDNWGDKFVCEPSHPLLTSLYKPRYAARNPFFVAPRELLDVASPATRVFIAAPLEAREPGPGGAPARAPSQAGSAPAQAWLTNACGGVIYRGNAFPPSYQGNAFVADPQAHVIHRFLLRDNGLEPIASRPAEERNTEFLASADPSFRPVQMLNGPDGALYVVDRQDGGGRGRIYRIVPLDFKRPKPPQLGKASTYDLVAMLSHPNGWQRDTAARLLYQRQDPAAATPLAKVLGASLSPLARLHALHALEGSGALKQELLLQALGDKDGRVREHAVLLSERQVVDGAIPDPIWNQLPTMTADPSLRVRYQLAFTLGEVHRPERAQALADILLRDRENPWVQAAVLSSVPEGAGDLFLALGRNAEFRNGQSGQAFLRRLATMIGVQGQPEDAAQVVDFIDQTALGQEQATALLASLGEGVYFGGSAYFQIDPTGRRHRLFTSAFAIAANPFAEDALRTDALRAVSVGPDMFASGRNWLLDVLGNGQPAQVHSAELAVLGRFDDPQITPALIQDWPVFTPRMRRDAVAALLTRANRVGDVMAALQDGRISPDDVRPTQRDFLRTYPDEATRQSALQLFGPVPAHRAEVVARFTPALGLTGAPDRGRETFVTRCASCHRVVGQAQGLGGNLVAARTGGRGKVLTAILEPNAEIQPNAATCVVETAAGEILIGVLLDENPATIALGQPNGVQVVLPRANVRSVQSQAWSLMPTGLEEGLSPQDMADLLEYVMTVPR